MIARTLIEDTYLSAKQLGIREDEREALIAVRNDLDDGRISEMKFDMMSPCGSCCCIGGHVATKLGLIQIIYVYDQESLVRPLYCLFFPDSGASWNATSDQAVRAIDSWLTGAGDRCWHVALESEA